MEASRRPTPSVTPVRGRRSAPRRRRPGRDGPVYRAGTPRTKKRRRGRDRRGVASEPMKSPRERPGGTAPRSPVRLCPSDTLARRPSLRLDRPRRRCGPRSQRPPPTAPRRCPSPRSASVPTDAWWAGRASRCPASSCRRWTRSRRPHRARLGAHGRGQDPRRRICDRGRGSIRAVHRVPRPPSRRSSNQKYRDFQNDPTIDVGLMTGDVTINKEAPVLIMTTEILRNAIFESPRLLHDVAYVIFDEVHYLDARERATVWEESAHLPPRRPASSPVGDRRQRRGARARA